jgi:hypothetical protein
MQLTANVNVTKEVTIEINEHIFFKHVISAKITNYLAVIEESTIKIFSFPGERTCLELDSTEDSIRIISEAMDSWEHISEEEFFEAMNKALKDFNFKPSLRVVTAKEGSEVSL